MCVCVCMSRRSQGKEKDATLEFLGGRLSQFLAKGDRRMNRSAGVRIRIMESPCLALG